MSKQKAKTIKPGFCLISLVALLISLGGCLQKPYRKEAILSMGTVTEITCQDKSAIQEAFAAIKKIEQIANNFEPASEISLLNRNQKIKPSPELLDLIRESIKFYNLSEGAFDITVAPLAMLWKKKIREAALEDKSHFTLPPESEIKDMLGLLGSDKIYLNESQPLIAFNKPGMSVDLGGIAKGYAVDYAVKRLKELGVSSALVNIGGNLYCLGRKYNKKWRIGIQDPRRPEKIAYYLNLENQATATSGDYEQYFIYRNKRFNHIINPKTGYPVASGIISVTIIADSATKADGLSTAVFVLGKEKGLALLRKIGNVESRIIEEDKPDKRE